MSNALSAISLIEGASTIYGASPPPRSSKAAETLSPETASPETASPETASPETASPGTEVLVEEDTGRRTDEPWHVILYNDEIHTFEEVISQLVKATGCTTAQAEEWAWEVHTQGKATVYEGDFEECFRVQGILREIQLVTEIEG